MNSIRTRLMVSLIAGPAVVLAGGGAAILATAGSSLDRHLDDQLAARALALSSAVSVKNQTLIIDEPEASELAGLGATYEIRDPRGVRLSGASVGGALPTGAVPALSNVHVGEGWGRTRWAWHQPEVEAADHLELDEGEREFDWSPSGQVLVGVMIDRGPTDDAKESLSKLLAIVGTGTALAIATLAAGAIRWGLAPLDRLRARLESVDARTLSEPVSEPRAPRELVPVYAALNAAMDRLGEAMQRERLFTHAAAHELRTPLAELRTTLEVSARWPDPERTLHALSEASDIGHEMEALVEALLTISRADGVCVPGKADLAPLIRDAAQQSASDARANGMSIEFEVDDGAWLGASAGTAAIIVRNLFENAIHHSPARARIVVRASAGRLEIENGPVGLTEAELPLMFEPFWRADAARDDRRHVGLGLSVVKRLAEASGLRVRASLHDQMLRMSVVG